MKTPLVLGPGAKPAVQTVDIGKALFGKKLRGGLAGASFRKAGRHPPANVEDMAGLMRGLVVGLVLDIGRDESLSPADSAAQQLDLGLRSVIAQGEPVNS